MWHVEKQIKGPDKTNPRNRSAELRLLKGDGGSGKQSEWSPSNLWWRTMGVLWQHTSEEM